MKTIVEIQNLKCGGCQNTIQKKLSQLSNISDIQISVDESTVAFSYDSDDDLNKVVSTLSKLGYPVIGTDNSLRKKAQSYVSCAIGRVQK